MDCISAASAFRPVRSMPIAWVYGIRRTSWWMPPSSASRPTRGSVSPKRAVSAAITMSAPSTISMPPPSA